MPNSGEAEAEAATCTRGKIIRARGLIATVDQSQTSILHWEKHTNTKHRSPKSKTEDVWGQKAQKGSTSGGR